MKGPLNIMARALSEALLPAGTVVSYEQQGTLFLAYVRDSKKAKLALLNNRGRELELSSNRLHKLPKLGAALSENNTEIAAALTSALSSAEKLMKEISIEELWSVTNSESREYTNSELTELCFGKDTFQEHLALRLALISDKAYFKRKKEFFEPRSESNVEEVKKSQAVQSARLRLRESAAKFFEERLKNYSLPIPDELNEFIESLKEIAVRSPNTTQNQQKECHEFLAELNSRIHFSKARAKERVAYALLRNSKILDRMTNLATIRHKFNANFPEWALEEAAELAQSRTPLRDSIEPLRKDLTSLRTITIDDESTQDMDDALSLERTEDGYQIGIHISDVASLVPASSRLNTFARERTTSVYSPEKIFHMFPEQLSEDAASLVQGEVRPALTFLFHVSSTLDIENVELFPSQIRVQDKLSYNAADKALINGEGADGDLYWLYQFALTREAERFTDGGYKVHKRDIQIGVSSEGEVALHPFDENGPARMLIGEMMILTNAFSAQFAKENSIPFIYRSQEAPERQAPIPEGIPDGPAYDYAARQGLKPSITSEVPGSHHTLGLKHYAQTTSPIRRYTDLINQRQLINFLGETGNLLTTEQIQEEIAYHDHARGIAMNVSKESRRYWILEYLRQRKKTNDTIRATVIRIDLKHPLIELEECFLSTIVRTNHQLSLGQEVVVRLNQVDPVFDEIRLEVVGE